MKKAQRLLDTRQTIAEQQMDGEKSERNTGQKEGVLSFFLMFTAHKHNQRQNKWQCVKGMMVGWIVHSFVYFGNETT